MKAVKTIFGAMIAYRKFLFTLVVAFFLFVLANNGGYSLFEELLAFVVNTAVFYFAAKGLVSSAGSKNLFKGKKFKFVVVDKEETSEQYSGKSPLVEKLATNHGVPTQQLSMGIEADKDDLLGSRTIVEAK